MDNLHYSCFTQSPNKKIVFRETQPYLNLLVKPRFFFSFSGKKLMLFKFMELYFFQKKKCVPTLTKLSDGGRILNRIQNVCKEPVYFDCAILTYVEVESCLPLAG